MAPKDDVPLRPPTSQVITLAELRRFIKVKPSESLYRLWKYPGRWKQLEECADMGDKLTPDVQAST